VRPIWSGLGDSEAGETWACEQLGTSGHYFVSAGLRSQAIGDCPLPARLLRWFLALLVTSVLAATGVLHRYGRYDRWRSRSALRCARHIERNARNPTRFDYRYLRASMPYSDQRLRSTTELETSATAPPSTLRQSHPPLPRSDYAPGTAMCTNWTRVRWCSPFPVLHSLLAAQPLSCLALGWSSCRRLKCRGPGHRSIL